MLDAAQEMVQRVGANAMSYADLSDAVGIRKASIHHHFPTKAELAVALMTRYRATFGGALMQITRDHASVGARLAAYKQLFANVLRDDHRLCMCGMFAADYETLPPEVRHEVRAFFDDNEAWLTSVLGAGKKGRAQPRARARVVLAAFEGAMLVARTYRDVAMFEEIADRVLANL